METVFPVLQFQRLLLRWYKTSARDFVWRAPNPEPYLVLVSEVMLQQTQTSRVQEKLPDFLWRFPTLAALAAANNAEIIKAWQGMGYNSRALRLRDCAAVIQREYGGIIPASLEQLKALPGIGEYTAAAICTFAFHQPVPVIDVNIRRVYSRMAAPMPTTLDTLAKQDLLAFALSVIPKKRSAIWHHAVMDVGALYCTARAPLCNECPVRRYCASAGAMERKTAPKRPEPEFLGTPNRIWRGRIIELLRSEPNNTLLSLNTLLHKLKRFALKPASKSVQPWIIALLDKLEKDGLILQQMRQNTIWIGLSREVGA